MYTLSFWHLITKRIMIQSTCYIAIFKTYIIVINTKCTFIFHCNSPMMIRHNTCKSLSFTQLRHIRKAVIGNYSYLLTIVF